MSLLGYQGRLDWKQTADGLLVTLPAEKPCDYTCTLKITGSNLTPATIVPDRLKPDAKGT